MKLIELHSEAKLNPGKLKQCAWLLTGFRLFEKFGYEIGAITEEKFEISLSEAVAIFHKLCVIDFAEEQEKPRAQEKYHIPALPQPARNALAYLYAIDKLLNLSNVVPLGEELPDGIYGGWYKDEMLYLRNTETYKQVKNFLRDYTDVRLGSSGQIYKYLFNVEGIITEKRDNGFGKVKYPLKEQVIHLDIHKSKKFLIDRGCELSFLDHL